MKKHLALSLCLVSLLQISCEDIKFKDLKPFNGQVIIGISNLSDSVQLIDNQIGFEVSQGLAFLNTLNNKKVTFDYNEIQHFSLGLSIMDTLGKQLVQNVDFSINQIGTSFSDGRIYPIWNSRSQKYESNFGIVFLKKGVFTIYSDGPSLSLKRDNFLFRDKTLTVDFDVEKRNLDLAKKYFSQYFDYLDDIGENLKVQKFPGYPGLFTIRVE